MLITVPLHVMLPRKTKPARRIALDQNTFHHVDRFTFNESKIQFGRLVHEQLQSYKDTIGCPWDAPVELIFIYFNWQRRLSDLSNHCVIVDKFFSDCLVNEWIITADDYLHVKEVKYKYGWYSKNNPHIDIYIQRLTNDTTRIS